MPIRRAVANEQRQSVSREDNVRCAWKIAASKAKPKPKLVCDSSDVGETSRWRRRYRSSQKAPPIDRDFAIENADVFGARFPHYHVVQPYR